MLPFKRWKNFPNCKQVEFTIIHDPKNHGYCIHHADLKIPYYEIQVSDIIHLNQIELQDTVLHEMCHIRANQTGGGMVHGKIFARNGLLICKYQGIDREKFFSFEE
jgi:hypothetical protein